MSINIGIMDVFKGENMPAFAKGFPDYDSSMAYLAQIKWDTGFISPKCAHNKACLKAGYRYHGYSCGVFESATKGYPSPRAM